MLRCTFFTIVLLSCSAPVICQDSSTEKVAYYSFGRIGTGSYEQLAFQVKNGRRGEVTYTYGKNQKSIDLSYLTHDKCGNEPCFMVRMPNNLTLQVIPKGEAIKVVSDEGRYSKIFGWEYIGPVNGIGMWCEICAEDEKEAMVLLRKYFLK